jgi:predicted PurR-regulated permease PerM
MSHETWDLTLQVIAVVVPLFMTVIFMLLAYAVKETIARVHDKVNSVQTELSEHKDKCDKIDKSVLLTRLDAAEKEISALRKLAHWVVESIGRIAGKLNVILPDRPQ